MTTHWSKGGRHPDLDDDGSLRPDYAYFSHEGTRALDFNRELSDPTSAQRFMAGVARMQAELPPEVQQQIQGKTYAAGGTPARGYQEYLAEIEVQKRRYAADHGYSRFVTDADIERMSAAEADEVLDEKGRPKPGVLLWRTSRSQVLDDRSNTRRSG